MENAAWLSQLTVNLTKLKNYCQLSRWPLTSETDDEFSFLGLGTLPYIGNFVHIGGFLFGLFASLALLPRTNYRCRSLAVNSCVKAIFVTLLLILLVCMCVAFFLVRNPKKFCSWCHYVDCVPYKKDHFCPSMDSDGFLDNGTWRQVTIMFRVVANSTPVGIRLRAVSLTPWFNEHSIAYCYETQTEFHQITRLKTNRFGDGEGCPPNLENFAYPGSSSSFFVILTSLRLRNLNMLKYEKQNEIDSARRVRS